MAWAGDTACPGSYTPITFGSATNPIGAANGCYATDVNFTNFGLTNSVGGSPAPTAPTIGQVYLESASNATNQVIWLTSSAGCGSWCANGGGYSFFSCPGLPNTDCGTFYQPGSVQSQTSFTATVNPALVSLPPGQYYAITSMALNPSAISNSGGYFQSTYTYNGSTYNYESDSIVEQVESYCVGVSSAAECTSANQGQIVYYTQNTSTGTNTQSYAYEPGFVLSGCSNCVTFAGPGYTQIYVQDTVYVALVGTGLVNGGVMANSFGESLETPEPSTFWLLASGLGAVAWLRRKTGRPLSFNK